jgi:hypothetical protein
MAAEPGEEGNGEGGWRPCAASSGALAGRIEKERGRAREEEDEGER